MDASKIEAYVHMEKFRGRKTWKWKVAPTNEIVKHEDGTPWVQPMSNYAPDKALPIQVGVVNPNAYF